MLYGDAASISQSTLFLPKGFCPRYSRLPSIKIFNGCGENKFILVLYRKLNYLCERNK
jgi:hypothetical protein